MDNRSDFYCLRLSHPEEELVAKMESVSLTRGSTAFAKKYFREAACCKRRGNKPSYNNRTQKSFPASTKPKIGSSGVDGLDFRRRRPSDDAHLVEFIDDNTSLAYIADLIHEDLDHSITFNRSIDLEFQMPGVYSAMIFRMDGYFLSYFGAILQSSVIYRSKFYENFASELSHYETSVDIPEVKQHNILSILINLKPPIQHFMDPLGSDLANVLLHEKHDLDCALSWLSTLGGAFSSLGESSMSWAKSAGEISLKQLKLAMRLKDPLVTSRCRIYLALSLIQRGYLRPARYILENEFKFFLSLPPGMDNRLGAMCKGVWHKLKYEWNRHFKRKQLRTGGHDISGQVG